ncbi:prolyl aminopeptidase [Streptomyces sp. JJ66]|uniref:prolyl aminopeptidase n=1 Tax=Streptomyces sp. JJ66 TaxID=2803843 RepID=UPI001C5A2B06|nr:prolyl aminopeptidase [Streptomyces sp. JJ66]MBW1600759.1 prolyl aminopeptidase [Streptomyces sp. JJ66]
MAELYPEIEPYAHGMLDVGNGHHMYWEACGNPDGKPALVVHGGPGSGCTPHARRCFDPRRYRVILFDQRGCGRSTPHASDPATDLTHNTTHHLLGDMETLRAHLGIERWLLCGGSWGSTLLLAYAERHPERVSDIVISAVTTTRRTEIDWLLRGVGRYFPEAWERFRAAAGTSPGADGCALAAAYARRMTDPDRREQQRAAADWCAWEDAVISLEEHHGPTPYGGRPSASQLALVRIVTHYFAHGAWLEEGALLRDAYRLRGIPGVLIHGRLDLGSPPDTAWALARAWPDARLLISPHGGHLSTEWSRARLLTALDAFAER